MKRFLSCLTALALAAALMVPMASAAYTDVPAGSALASEVQKAASYGLMNGYSAGIFGYSDSMTRAQFVTVVGRMLGWFQGGMHSTGNHITSAMKIPETLSGSYLDAINFAVEYDVVDTNVAFRPNDPVTRREMAEILVRALGLKEAAAIAEKQNTLPFTDVKSGKGYISIAYTIGMTNGTSATTFSPDATATRGQAAAMLVRIYEKLNQKTDFIHGFYAISSYSQLSYAKNMDRIQLRGGKRVLCSQRLSGRHVDPPELWSRFKAGGVHGHLRRRPGPAGLRRGTYPGGERDRRRADSGLSEARAQSIQRRDSGL